MNGTKTTLRNLDEKMPMNQGFCDVARFCIVEDGTMKDEEEVAGRYFFRPASLQIACA